MYLCICKTEMKNGKGINYLAVFVLLADLSASEPGIIWRELRIFGQNTHQLTNSRVMQAITHFTASNRVPQLPSP